MGLRAKERSGMRARIPRIFATKESRRIRCKLVGEMESKGFTLTSFSKMREGFTC